MPFWPSPAAPLVAAAVCRSVQSVMTAPLAVPTRHPMDPDPTGSTKARAVFALGLAALLSGALVGGVIPATIALLLARQTHRQQYASGGYLTGSAWIRRGRRLAWAGIILALTAIVVAVIAGLLNVAGAPGQDFDTNTD
jgi:(hydroxyamino)benzene mutase